MNVIAFNYTDSRGHTTDWKLYDWEESGRYIKGICEVDDGFRTFRKDRINNYLDEMEDVLTTPYTPPPPHIETRPAICFTGYPKAQRAALEQFAGEHEMLVRKNVTQDLVFLCCGPNAGPVKVEKARYQGCLIIDEPALKTMVETGELPEPWEFEC